MKKVLGILTLVVFLVLFAGNVLADSSADASSAASSSATATNNQTQGQEQTLTGTGGNGSSVVTSPRQHIAAPAGPSGDFVGAPTTLDSDGWQELKCQPLLRVFTPGQLKSAAKGSVVQSSLRQEKVKADGGNVVRLDFIPQDAVLLGEFIVEGKDGEGIIAPLSKAILMAAETTNTHRVFVWVRSKKGAKNSGLSIGSGAGGAISSANTSKAIGLGGLLGWTWADTTASVVVKVWAFGEGPIDPPAGVCPCGECGEKTTPPLAPKAAPKAETPKPCPPTPVEREIAERYGYRWPCLTLSHNNGQIHAVTGMAWVKHYKCSGEGGDLLAAIEQFKAAEKNLLGPDAKRYHGKEAGILLTQVYRLWAGSLFQLEGREKALEFAGKKGLREIPTGIAR